MSDQLTFGSSDLSLPDELREPLKAHLRDLREAYVKRHWAGRVGLGQRPAIIVIDLATYWLDPGKRIGSNLNSVLESVCKLLEAARAAQVPIIFTTYDNDPAYPFSPHDLKLQVETPDAPGQYDLDPRLERRATEKIVRKRFASAFKGTYLNEMLAGMGIDTLIVTGVSTSHCVYATCRDATDSFRVIVPREAVGERCELMHEVFLTDIDIDLADVMPLAEVIAAIKK